MNKNDTKYYGFIDKVERVKNTYHILIDSILKSDFDLYFERGGDHLLEEESYALIYFSATREEAKGLISPFYPYKIETRWSLVSLNGNKSVTANIQKSSITDIDETSIEHIRLLDGRKSEDKTILKELKNRFSLTNLGVKDIEQIRKIETDINSIKPKFVTVYNVGQGNANAICDTKDSEPLLYFDLGGGCYNNAITYPKLKTFSTKRDPIVFLSHWDFDHFYTAFKDKQLQKLNWIVPDQLVGANTHKFAQNIHLQGKLFLWTNVKPISNKSLEINLCTGKNRNDSGLAIFVKSNDQAGSKFTLLPGDARYKCIPSIQNYNLNQLVASHHGATYKGKLHVPVTSSGSIAYSYGKNNTYSHPQNGMIRECKAKGWKSRKDTIKGNIAFLSAAEANRMNAHIKNRDLLIKQTY